jgi:hypothetical protein
MTGCGAVQARLKGLTRIRTDTDEDPDPGNPSPGVAGRGPLAGLPDRPG